MITRSHQWIDRRSLAMHVRVAEKVAGDPELLDVARRNLHRWLERSPQPALLEWKDLLDSLSLKELLDLLRSPDERAARLRQSSPFAGILTPEERRKILADYESRSA